MLDEGKTLGEINSKLHIWYELPEYLENVNKDSCFIISYWQCCNKPAYQIKSIEFNGNAYVSGFGRWDGHYGREIYINSDDLKNPKPKEELFIYKK